MKPFSLRRSVPFLLGFMQILLLIIGLKDLPSSLCFQHLLGARLACSTWEVSTSSKPSQGSKVCPYISTQELPPAMLQLHLCQAFGMLSRVILAQLCMWSEWWGSPSITT